mmetsp:Transcript_32340/g.86689  ORF Transcript_32340/g.86689 Transcript_32340/m.86689 type:complete len:294 (-) Transcript_32340:99-980(-)
MAGSHFFQHDGVWSSVAQPSCAKEVLCSEVWHQSAPRKTCTGHLGDLPSAFHTPMPPPRQRRVARGYAFIMDIGAEHVGDHLASVSEHLATLPDHASQHLETVKDYWYVPAAVLGAGGLAATGAGVYWMFLRSPSTGGLRASADSDGSDAEERDSPVEDRGGGTRFRWPASLSTAPPSAALHIEGSESAVRGTHTSPRRRTGERSQGRGSDVGSVGALTSTGTGDLRWWERWQAQPEGHDENPEESGTSWWNAAPLSTSTSLPWQRAGASDDGAESQGSGSSPGDRNQYCAQQ